MVVSEMDTLTTHSSQSSSLLPWVEKYRPATLSSIAHHTDIVQTLRSASQSASLPHLLFYGGPGTGKTSTILATAFELYGPLMKSRVLELNASHERGIDVIRHRVKEFAQLSVSNNPNSDLHKSMNDTEIRTFPCPPFKLIILDEADNLTKDAQMALRRIMETYAKVTRFCLICNYVSRMIDPIVSRCAKFRFTSLPRDVMKQRLELICQTENIRLPAKDSNIMDAEMSISEDDSSLDITEPPNGSPLDTLCDISQGDLRQAITLLQSASKLLSPTSTLTSSMVEELACVVPTSFISELHSVIKKNNFTACHQLARRCMKEGYGGEVVLHSWLKIIVRDSSISEIKKAKMLVTLGEVEKCLVDGANEYLQMLYCIGQLTQILHGPE